MISEVNHETPEINERRRTLRRNNDELNLLSGTTYKNVSYNVNPRSSAWENTIGHALKCSKLAPKMKAL